MHRTRGKLTYSNVVSTLCLVLLVGGGSAFAASNAGTSTPATLKLCAAKKSGDLRLLSGGGSCKAGEQALTVDSRGTKGADGSAGPAGPAGATGSAGATGERGTQGERGLPGSSVLASPDGRLTVAATNAGIVMTGPKGSLSFDGEELLSGGSLKITAPLNLTLLNGTALEITSGTSASFTTGASFSQTVGAAYTQDVGGTYSQSVGNNYSQSIANGYTQEIGGAVEQTIDKGFKQRIGGTYDAVSDGSARLGAPALQLGASGCQLAARVGSEVNGFLKVTAVGSSSTVSIC